MPNEFEMGVIHQMKDVVFAAGKEIINTKNIVAVTDKTFTKIGTEETGTAGYKNSFS